MNGWLIAATVWAWASGAVFVAATWYQHKVTQTLLKEHRAKLKALNGLILEWTMRGKNG